jgi:integrase
MQNSTVAEAIAHTIAEMEVRLSPNGIRSLRSHAKMFTSLWGDLPMTQLRTRDLQEFVARRRKEVTNSTIRHQLAFLRQVFSEAIEQGRTEANPVASVKARLPINKRSEWLREHEEPELKEAYFAYNRFPLPEEGGSQRTELEWDAVRFALLTGARRGEQLNLTAKQVSRAGVVLQGKTGPRTVPLHPEAREITERWLNYPGRPNSKFIFWPWQQVDRIIWAQSAVNNKTFRPICDGAGFRDLHWHDLRRSFACRLVAKGVGIFEVQRLLGHASPQQTMTYCAVSLEQLTSAVLKLT